MELVERLADTMLLMNKGRAVAQGSLQEIRNTLLPKPVYRVTTNAQLALDSWQGVEQIESIRKVSEEQVEITFRTDAGIDELWPQLAQQVSIKAFAPIQPGLHDLYLDTIRRQASDERSSEEAQS